MAQPKIEIAVVCSAGGDIANVTVNGFRAGTVWLNDPTELTNSLECVVRTVYNDGHIDGVRESKRRVRDVMDWANSPMDKGE